MLGKETKASKEVKDDSINYSLLNQSDKEEGRAEESKDDRTVLLSASSSGFSDSVNQNKLSLNSCLELKLDEKTKKDLRKLSFAIILAFVFILPLVICFYKYDVWYAHHIYQSEDAIIEDNYVTYPSFQDYMSQKSNKDFSILLFGDSLIEHPEEFSGLSGKVKGKLVYNESIASVNIATSGEGGSKVQNLLQRLPALMENASYDGIIIFWDSDISDFSVNTLYSSEYQDHFKTRVKKLLSELQTTYKIPYISLAGPGILGEAPPIHNNSFRNKRRLLDLYRNFNREICKQFSVPYINIREAFLNAIPLSQVNDARTITIDGEHPNSHGTEIEARLFANQINRWFKA